MAHYLNVHITPEDILNKLPEECKKEMNQCVITDVKRWLDGSVDISCVLFWDEDNEDKTQEPSMYMSLY